MADKSAHIFEFALQMGDNCLVLGQQLSKWCGHAPALEEDIATANTALDLIGQTKLWFQLAAEHSQEEIDPDKLAFLRDVRGFKNCLLVEQPDDDFSYTLMRQFLFDAWHAPMLEQLQFSTDTRIAEIAAKSIKEVRYHLERSGDLVTRLGAGSAESHERMQTALNALWRFTAELTLGDPVSDALTEQGAMPALDAIKATHSETMKNILSAATLKIPEDAPMAKGGKQGLHSEAFGKMIAEMQWLQRAYPGAEW